MPCPICDEDSQEQYRPFCSKRCADIDLGRWMLESYAVPAEEEDHPDAHDLAHKAPSPRPH